MSASLAAFLDHELDELETNQVREHLGRCAGCRAAEVDLRSLKRLLANAAQPQIDPRFEAKVSRWISDPSELQSGTAHGSISSSWQFAPFTFLALWLISQTIVPASPDNESTSGHFSKPISARDDSAYELTAVSFGR